MATKPRMLEEVGHVMLTLRFEREDKNWVGTCVELGTSTFARSLPKVQEELHELVADHLNALEEVGERERFVEKHRIEIQRTTASDEVTLRAPFSDTEDLGPPITLAPLFQPHFFPFTQSAEADNLARA